MKWPGVIDPLTRAASILRLPNGQFILRAYGTLPHPNILGGFLLLCFIGCIAIYVRKERPIALSLSLLALGACTLAMSFSRSAWLGAGAFLFILLVKSKFFETKKIFIAVAVIAFAFVATLVPLRSLFLSRTSTATPSESFAVVGRTWLIQKALTYTRERPLTGVGIGSFIIQLAKRDGQRDFVEPVHNSPILVLSELGIFGLIILILIAGNIGWRLYQTRNPKAILIGAILAGMGVIALLDHYFWTLAPGRIMLALALGLWEGQSSHDD
jgi:O-antigen ligase